MGNYYGKIYMAVRTYAMIYMQGFIYKGFIAWGGEGGGGRGEEGTSARMPNNGVRSIQLQRMFPNPESEHDKQRVNHL